MREAAAIRTAQAALRAVEAEKEDKAALVLDDQQMKVGGSTNRSTVVNVPQNTRNSSIFPLTFSGDSNMKESNSNDLYPAQDQMPYQSVEPREESFAEALMGGHLPHFTNPLDALFKFFKDDDDDDGEPDLGVETRVRANSEDTHLARSRLLKRRPNSLLSRAWHLMEDPESSFEARALHRLLLVLIFASICMLYMQTMTQFADYGESTPICGKVLFLYCEDKTRHTDPGCFVWNSKGVTSKVFIYLSIYLSIYLPTSLEVFILFFKFLFFFTFLSLSFLLF